MSYWMSSLAGRSVLFVMAAEPEYGACLKARIEPLMTGVGPVEAAVALARELALLSVDDRLPDLVVSLGSAGSATLEHCGLYQAISVSYRDMDASALGFEKGVTPLSDIPAIIDLPLRVPGIATARLSTGANVVSGAAYASIDADMVDMESFALVRAAMGYNLPFVGLRGISDGKHELGGIADWTAYLHIIDEKLAAAIDAIEAGIALGDIALTDR